MIRSRAALSSLVLLACSGKADWQAHDAGPLTIEFPCAPSRSAAVVKCTMSDGSEYALATVDKGILPEEELAQIQEYLRTQPKVEVLDDSGFPLKWRESRQFRQVDSWLYYLDGKEYTASVEFVTPEPPAAAKKFFSSVKVAPEERPDDASDA